MDFNAPDLNLIILAPLFVVIVWGMVIMLLDLVVSQERKQWIGWLSLVGYLVALVITVFLWGTEEGAFTPAGGHPMLLVDNYSNFLNVIFLLTGIISVLFSINYLSKAGIERGEFYYLMMFSISGMMLMGMANDLILVFLALELLSIPLYVLSGFARPRLDSEESAMKYFLLGAFASGFLVFGVALIYGGTGSTALPDVVANIGSSGVLGAAGAAFILVGLGFKVAAVPFHMWTPDVYEGAPTAVTAFMSVGAKVGGFAALIRIFITALPDLDATWVPILAVISAITMIVGNVVALSQQNIKRMLGYSSIAHAGYIMMGVAAAGESPNGVSAALFYMLAYLFTNLGAFAVVIAVERRDGEGVMLDDYKGLARRSPLMALALAYFMLSLTGVPPTGGFSGKFFIFQSVLEADLVWLAIIGVITSVISGYFYLRVVYYAYMYEGEGEVTSRPELSAAVAISAAVTLFLGILPGTLFVLAQEAAVSSLPHILAGLF